MVDLDIVIRALKKSYKSAKIASNRENPSMYVPTGNLAFDLISDGGIPFGYMAEFMGLSQSGKSLFIQQLISNAQQKFDAVGILVDRENAYTKSRGTQLGINNDNLILAESSDTPLVYMAFQFILDSISGIRSQDKHVPIIVGVDSISAFGKDVSMEKADPGRKAKAVHEGLRELLSFIDKNVLVIIANQITYAVGVIYGNPKVSTAGESMKYYSTLRFALQDKKKIIDTSKGNEVIGSWIGIEAIKTRLGPCYRTCYIPHFYKSGIDYYGGYARLLVDRGFLKPKNKQEFISFNQRLLTYGDGEDVEQVNEFEIEKFLEKHPELLFSSYPEYGEIGGLDANEV